MENHMLPSNLGAVSMNIMSDGGQRRRIFSKRLGVASLNCRCFLPWGGILGHECRCVPALFSSWGVETPSEPRLLPFCPFPLCSSVLPCHLYLPESLRVSNGVPSDFKSNMSFLREIKGDARRRLNAFENLEHPTHP